MRIRPALLPAALIIQGVLIAGVFLGKSTVGQTPASVGRYQVQSLVAGRPIMAVFDPTTGRCWICDIDRGRQWLDLGSPAAKTPNETSRIQKQWNEAAREIAEQFLAAVLAEQWEEAASHVDGWVAKSAADVQRELAGKFSVEQLRVEQVYADHMDALAITENVQTSGPNAEGRSFGHVILTLSRGDLFGGRLITDIKFSQDAGTVAATVNRFLDKHPNAGRPY